MVVVGSKVGQQRGHAKDVVFLLAFLVGGPEDVLFEMFVLTMLRESAVAVTPKEGSDRRRRCAAGPTGRIKGRT
jgi:hypothetical protein